MSLSDLRKVSTGMLRVGRLWYVVKEIVPDESWIGRPEDVHDGSRMTLRRHILNFLMNLFVSSCFRWK